MPYEPVETEVDASRIQGRYVSYNPPTSNDEIVWNSTPKQWSPESEAASGTGELFTNLDFTSSNLTSIATRNFSDLQNIPATNLVYVDSVNGSDSTGLVHRADRPFLTPTAAESASSSNDTIVLIPGTYEDSGLARRYFLYPGVILNGADTSNDSIFEYTADTHVGGFGQIVSSEIGAIYTSDFNYFLEADTFKQTGSGSRLAPIYISNATTAGKTVAIISHEEISNAATISEAGAFTLPAGAVWWQGGKMFIRSPLVSGKSSINFDCLSDSDGHVEAEELYGRIQTVSTDDASAGIGSTVAALWVTGQTLRPHSSLVARTVVSQNSPNKLYLTEQKIFGSFFVGSSAGATYFTLDKWEATANASVTANVLADIQSVNRVVIKGNPHIDPKTYTGASITSSGSDVWIIGATLVGNSGLNGFSVTAGTLNLVDCSLDFSANSSTDAITVSGGTLNIYGGSLVSNAAKKDINNTGGTVNVDSSVNYDATKTSGTIVKLKSFGTSNLATFAGITPGTGVGTALAVNVGSAGAFVTNGGALGTPSSGTLTNATGLPITGITSSTSAQLRTLLSDENGTGAALFDGATSPTFVTPALGTPSALVGTNITGTGSSFTAGHATDATSLSISGQTGLLSVTGLTSTNRIKTVRDAADTILELGGSYTPTGTWTNLTLVTPALGTPASGVVTNLTGTASININGTVGATTPAAGTFTSLTGTSGTLAGLTGLAIRDTSAAFDVTLAATSSTTLTAGRTLTLNMGNVAHTLALGTTAGTITFPNTAAMTVARTDAAQTFTGVQTMTSPAITTPAITTGINDANGNSMLAFTATASAVDGFTFTNAATANPATVTMAATGSDSNITLALTPKGSGKLTSAGNTTLTAGTTSSSTATGTLVITGGLGVSGAFYQGGDVNLGSSSWGIASATGNQRLSGTSTLLGWTTGSVISGTYLAAITSNGTGIEVNNGTAGQWGTLKSGVRDSGTTTVTNGLTIGHQSTGTPAAGLGSGILFNINSSTTADQNAAQIAALWTDATHATRTADTVFYNVNSAAALAETFRVKATGAVSQVGKTTTYNNIATVSNGVPSELATIDSTGLTANVGASTLYAVPASGAGLYRVSAYLVTTTAASVSSTMPNAQVVYTDSDSNTSVTLDVSPILGAAGLGQSGLLTANAVGTVFSGTTVIYVKASTTIQYQTVNYASTAGGMAYALRMKLEAL